MNKYELQKRTRKFHVDVIRLCSSFPRTAAGFEIAKQVIRSAGSIGANYRAACRAKSQDDFIYKLDVILEEADESLYWLEVTSEAALIHSSELDRLLAEANELVAIFNASDRTAKANRSRRNLEIKKSRNPKSL